MSPTKTRETASAAGSDGEIGTRERIVRATARLLQRQGYEGTGLKQIAREAGATFGSVYHFFPGGKQELAAAAIRHGELEFAELLQRGLGSRADPDAAVAATARLLARELRGSGWTDGCPVTATALETIGRAPEIEQAVARAFAHWEGIVQAKLREAGLPERDARELACTVVNTLEGAEVAAQVAKSERPLRLAGTHLARLVASYERA